MLTLLTFSLSCLHC